MSYSKQIDFYKVIKGGFNAPLSESPSTKSIELNKNDILIVFDGEPQSKAYIKGYDEKSGDNHIELSLRKDFIELNKRLFKEIQL